MATSLDSSCCVSASQLCGSGSCFHFDADPDTPFYFADPDPAFHFDADPDPNPDTAFHFDADPDPQHRFILS